MTRINEDKRSAYNLMVVCDPASEKMLVAAAFMDLSAAGFSRDKLLEMIDSEHWLGPVPRFADMPDPARMSANTPKVPTLRRPDGRAVACSSLPASVQADMQSRVRPLIPRRRFSY
jgi:hypothetical protein